MDWCNLARTSLDYWLRHGRPPGTIPKIKKQAACFVSLHSKGGNLRGCMGTLEPRTGDLSEEVVTNVIAAASRDPRFETLQLMELTDLRISVSILNKPERIANMDQLDPIRFGVIVVQGARRGVLLPNLAGISHSQQQVDIACRKAGIDPLGKLELWRFETITFEESNG